MTTINTIPEQLLNERQVAEMTGLSVASVRRWRWLRQGPKYIKINSSVRYRREDITQWLNSRPTPGWATAGATQKQAEFKPRQSGFANVYEAWLDYGPVRATRGGAASARRRFRIAARRFMTEANVRDLTARPPSGSNGRAA